VVGLRVERVLGVLRLTDERAIAQQVGGVSAEWRAAQRPTVGGQPTEVRQDAQARSRRAEGQRRSSDRRAESNATVIRWQWQVVDLVCPGSGAGSNGRRLGHGRLADKAGDIERVGENVASTVALALLGKPNKASV